MPRRRKVLSFDSKLVAYSAMAGAVIAAGEARAADCVGGVLIGTVCYTDIPNQMLTDDGTIPIDFDGDGLKEFDLNFDRTSFTFTWLGSDRYQIYRTAWLDPAGVGAAMLEGFSSTLRGESQHRPGALVPGDIIGAPGFGTWAPLNTWGTLGYFSWYLGSGYFQQSRGNFVGKGQRFAGVRFWFDGETHYGWVRVAVAPHTASVTIYDFAFEMTPDTPCPTNLDLSVIFVDGFENGDTGRWSEVVQ